MSLAFSGITYISITSGPASIALQTTANLYTPFQSISYSACIHSTCSSPWSTFDSRRGGIWRSANNRRITLRRPQTFWQYRNVRRTVLQLQQRRSRGHQQLEDLERNTRQPTQRRSRPGMVIRSSKSVMERITLTATTISTTCKMT